MIVGKIMRGRTADDRRRSERIEHEILPEESAGCGGVAGETRSECDNEGGRAAQPAESRLPLTGK